MLLTNYSGAKCFDLNKSEIFDEYENWYAVQTITGDEKKLVSGFNCVSGKGVKLYLPTREVIHKIKGKVFRTKLPLFPGYLFVHKEIDTFMRIISESNLNLMARPVSADGKYLEVDRSEMRLLLEMTDSDGSIKISSGVITEKQEIEIVRGPLKNFKGDILFINRRKSKAKVRLEIMNRQVDVSLGLEIIEKKPEEAQV